MSRNRRPSRTTDAEHGREQFFRLTDDPTECCDLAAVPEEAERLSYWRNLLIGELKNRAEGFTDGARLISGRPYPAVCQPSAPADADKPHR